MLGFVPESGLHVNGVRHALTRPDNRGFKRTVVDAILGLNTERNDTQRNRFNGTLIGGRITQ